MTSYYMKVFASKCGYTPNVNRNSARWGFAGILTDINKDEVKELIDHLFNLPKRETDNYSLNWFLYNYDKVRDGLTRSKDYEAKRSKLMEASRERARKWASSGEHRVISNQFDNEE